MQTSAGPTLVGAGERGGAGGQGRAGRGAGSGRTPCRLRCGGVLPAWRAWHPPLCSCGSLGGRCRCRAAAAACLLGRGAWARAAPSAWTMLQPCALCRAAGGWAVPRAVLRARAVPSHGPPAVRPLRALRPLRRPARWALAWAAWRGWAGRSALPRGGRWQQHRLHGVRAPVPARCSLLIAPSAFACLPAGPYERERYERYGERDRCAHPPFFLFGSGVPLCKSGSALGLAGCFGFALSAARCAA